MPGWMAHNSNQDCWEKYQQPQIGRLYHSNGRKWRGTNEPLEEDERGEWKSWLKTQHSKLCWIVVVKVGTLVLFLTLGEMLSIFHHEDNVCCGFVIYSFYYVEVCSFYSCFLESFYHKSMLNFVKGFLCIYSDNHMAFIFQLLMWCITLIDLRILKNPCYPGIKPTWSWCMISLMCCWTLIARIF